MAMTTETPLPRTASAVDGVLLLDKPHGMTSNAALQAVRKPVRARQGGHTGTLDPLATGLLPICLGEATKFAGGLLEADKTYEAIVRLGVATTTGDAEGEPVFRGEVAGLHGARCRGTGEFRGDIEQMPPMFSALKHHGRPLYEYARAGEEVERRPRRVTVRASGARFHHRNRSFGSGFGAAKEPICAPWPTNRSALGVRRASDGAAAHRDRPLADRGGGLAGRAGRARRALSAWAGLRAGRPAAVRSAGGDVWIGPEREALLQGQAGGRPPLPARAGPALCRGRRLSRPRACAASTAGSSPKRMCVGVARGAPAGCDVA